ncbi:hypothetical protein [Aquabacter spiritensis]|uniref:Crp-like helix-turn-helix protein n=1 Tax=Aquabacter spiritensis TaxID=933073 RepID=A0A4R3M627_9HYPH|nr:hypothetical protein [Aquabacter spiritensis]TCT08053.1 hypothetical protein EDC64_101572 [Aquabacter spiritensis]
MICYILIHNYYFWRNASGPAPTLTALQHRVTASPRQTAGLVAALKVGRLVTAESSDDDGRIKRLRPAPAMIARIGRSVRAFVDAAEALDGADGTFARFAEPDALGDLMFRSAAHVLAHGTLIHPFPRILAFAARDCGYLVLCTVMRAHYAEMRAEAVPRLSQRALAARLQVSPAHIGNLLGEADRGGWLTIGPRGRLTAIDPTLVAEFEHWASCQMAHFRRLAGESASFLARQDGLTPAPAP